MTCEEWLRQYLVKSGGCVLCDIVREEAFNQGFSRSELKAARKVLGVKTFHQFDEYGPTPNHFWYIEEDDTE